MGSWHETKLRVRFEETDLMQVVYYSKFFIWMEVGRINLLRDIGLSYQQWEKRGFHIPVVQAHADYKSSARFDDEILVKTRVGTIGTSSMKFENEILKPPDMELLVPGHTVHALIDKGGRTVPIPADLKRELISS